MISIGLVWPKLDTNSRCLALLTCVNPHVRLRYPELSRSELHWRSRGSEKVWRSDAELNTNRFQNGKSQNRFPPIWPCVTCRSFGGGSPTPQQFQKTE